MISELIVSPSRHRRPSRQRFQAAKAAALARDRVNRHPRVSELARTGLPALNRPPAGDDRGSNARPVLDVQHVILALPGSPQPRGFSPAARAVVQKDRHAKLRLENARQWNVPPELELRGHHPPIASPRSTSPGPVCSRRRTRSLSRPPIHTNRPAPPGDDLLSKALLNDSRSRRPTRVTSH